MSQDFYMCTEFVGVTSITRNNNSVMGFLVLVVVVNRSPM